MKDFFGFEISDFRIFVGKENFGKYFFGWLDLSREFFGCSKQSRGGEWYLEKCRSRKILAGSQNVGNVFDKS